MKVYNYQVIEIFVDAGQPLAELAGFWQGDCFLTGKSGKYKGIYESYKLNTLVNGAQVSGPFTLLDWRYIPVSERVRKGWYN